MTTISINVDDAELKQLESKRKLWACLLQMHYFAKQ